jgi:uric acid transporter
VPPRSTRVRVGESGARARQPLVQGTSFAAVASMLAIGKGAGGGAAGLTAIYGAVIVAGVVGFLILAIHRFLPGFLSRVAILAGLVLGTLVAWPFGKVDFSRIGQAQWFAVSTPFHFGVPQFQIAAIVSMVIVMLVIMTETTADILAIGEVIGRPAGARWSAVSGRTPWPPRSPAACSTASR